MRCVNDNNVYACFNEFFKTFFGSSTYANGSASKKFSIFVFRGIGVFGGFHNILNGNEAFKVKVFVDN